MEAPRTLVMEELEVTIDDRVDALLGRRVSCLRSGCTIGRLVEHDFDTTYVAILQAATRA
jgi:hypothetical protein